MSQLLSLPISFLSLVLASSRLFYSQRLGSFSDHGPSWKMTLMAAIPIMFLLPGLLYALIFIASYYRVFVILVIVLASAMNYFVLNFMYNNKSQTEEVTDSFYKTGKEYGTKETKFIFWMAVFTAWISPCTVWTNNFAKKTRFLLVSSSLTIAVDLLSVSIVYFLVCKAGLINNINPPISHCHELNTENKLFNTSKYQLYFNSNSSGSILHICRSNDPCLQIIRICSENEGLLENYDFWCYILGFSLLLLSWFASVCLQSMGSYTKLQMLARKWKFTCPRLYLHFLNDIATSFHEQSQVEQDILLYLVKKDILKGQEYVDCVQSKVDIFKEFSKNRAVLNKLEEMIEECNKCCSNKNEETAKTILWSPMHKAARKGHYGLWVFFNILGGEAGALNGHSKSSIQVIIDSVQRDPNKLPNLNPFVKWWIKNSMEIYCSNAMHNAVKLGDRILMQILMENGYDVDQPDENYQTPVHIAVVNGNMDCLKYLIKSGAKCETRDKHGQTPLHLSADQGNFDSLKYLIDRGADLTEKDSHGCTPLHLSSYGKSCECLKYLIERGANLEAKDEHGNTPLHLSAYRGNLEWVEYLIQKKAEVEATNNDKRTPLHLSAQFGKVECLKCLINSRANLEAVDKEGRTPLHISAERGSLECLQYLIHRGALVNAKDNENNTPLHLLRKLDKQPKMDLADRICHIGYKKNCSPFSPNYSPDFYWIAAEELIAAGADLSAVNKKRKTPMKKKDMKRLEKRRPELFPKNQSWFTKIFHLSNQ